MFAVCFVRSGLSDELITRSEESYSVCMCVCMYLCLCLIVCDLETSIVRWPRPHICCGATENNIYVFQVYFSVHWVSFAVCSKAEDP